MYAHYHNNLGEYHDDCEACLEETLPKKRSDAEILARFMRHLIDVTNALHKENHQFHETCAVSITLDELSKELGSFIRERGLS